MQRTTLKAPFGWVGGKSRLASKIVSLIPADHARYIEVFGGALSVFYQKEPSKSEIVNGINGELINLHRAVKYRPQTLAMELNTMLKSREIFYAIKNGRVKPRNDIHRAAMYFYLLATSFGSKGEHFAMNKDRSAKNIYKDFRVYSARLKRAVIENMSFERLIRQYDGEDAFFYADPPYVGTENYYKMCGDFGAREHELLAEILRDVKGRFLLSYNDCEVVRDLYRGFKFERVGVDYSLNGRARGTRSELIIMNY